MHVQRFQDSNERTDKNPWLGLRRVSVKQNPNLTITLNLKQHSLKINDRLRPRPRVLLTPVCKENFAKKRVVLRQDQRRDDIRPTALSMDRGRSGSYWDEISSCCVTFRAFFFTIFRFPFHLRGGSSARWQQKLLKDVEDDRTSQLLLGSHQSCSYNGFET